jgi:iron-sulfur cluster repair protein YtfE (RIC family)
MKKHLDRHIKEVLKDYPQLAAVLADYDINCYTCNGNCLFKDIFEEHNLSMKQEMEIKAAIAAIIPN